MQVQRPLARFVVTLLAALTPTMAAAAPEPPANVLANGGFEEVRDGKPAGWQIADGGISTLTEERARTGKRALKIVDASPKEGSGVTSAAVALPAGKRVGVRLWTYLQEGKPGLGVYVRYYGADGKEMAEAREKTNRAAAMSAGQWVPSLFVHTPPPGAVKAALWLHTYSDAQLTCYVDDVEILPAEPGAFEEAEEWSGGLPETEVVQVGKYAVRWAHAESGALSLSFEKPRDWSQLGALSFRLHSEKATKSAFMLIVNSENDASEGIDYYAHRIILDWTGWRTFVLPFRELGASRQPVGWKKVDGVSFTASGWGNKPDPAAVVRLDGFAPIPLSDKGPRMTDAELFESLDLDAPGLGRVKAAVAAGDLAGARKALAAHIRERKSPRWTFDWRDHPFLGAKVPGPEADRAPDQWDYYSTFLPIDWQGWKRLTFTKEQLTPRAFVEGEGWKGKQPIGWHWIRYLQFGASGWGLTPDPACVLYFDDVRLVGKKGAVTLADFEGERHSWDGLSRSDEQAKGGRFSGKWENHPVTSRVSCWKIPHDWSDYDALEMWVYSPKATGGKVVLVLDSDAPRGIEKAEELCARRFTGSSGAGGKAFVQMGERIDWKANPTEGEARTHLWNEALNRHFHFATLADAWWQTGNEKYARELIAHWMDWIEQNPAPYLSSGNSVEWPYGCYAWQTLTTGIRLEASWPNALYRCLSSPAMTDDALVAILKSTCEQARHLLRWPSGGNWLTEESVGLYTAGMLFPEFREAAEWRRTAIERLSKQLDEEIYPDGMEYELAAGYNNWVVSNVSKILDLAEMNGLLDEVPADYKGRIEKMYHYLLYASMPNGAIPGLNDSGNSDVRSLLTQGNRLFPHREDFLWVASGRARGKMPAETSYVFPYSGHYVMRSGWDADACFLLFDSGPYGYGHQHEDKLHFVLWAYGKQHVLDPGNYSYDASRWRRYVLTTPGHNTVLVDGEGQHRRGRRETHFWPRPWDTPRPKGDDTRWASTPEVDCAVGTYRDGYGPENDTAVTHTRRILFVKGDAGRGTGDASGGRPGALPYYLVVDTMQAADDKPHRYEALFHLDTPEARVDEESGVVRTENADASNLVLLPLRAEGTGMRIVKGQEDPVQGWANHPWRAIPTVITTREGKGTVHLVHALVPVPKGATVPVLSLEPVEAGQGIAVRLRFPDGSAHTFAQSAGPGKPVRLGGAAVDAEAILMMAGPDGKEQRTLRIETK